MQELSGVSEEAWDLAMSRFRLIQPYLVVSELTTILE